METFTAQQYDTVVVGGGVIGLSAAYELLQRGRRVLVLERDVPGAGATGAAGGMLAPTCEAELAEMPVVTLGFESLGRYPAWIKGLERISGRSCQYRDDGTLWVAFNRDDEGDLERVHAILERKGLTAQWLDAEAVVDREDFLSSRVQSALWVAEDHQLEPHALVDALCAAIHELGGHVASGVTVREIQTSGSSVQGVVACTREGQTLSIACGNILLAAGAWSTATITSPLEHLSVRPIKGQVVRLHGPQLLRHVVRTPDIYMVPRANGDLVIGATMEEMGFDTTPTAGAVMDFLRHAWRALPGIYDLQMVTCTAGLRPAARDHVPVVGATHVDGLFVATGHHRDGVLLAPATAHHLAELMVTGRQPPELAPFAPQRLRTAAA